MPERTVVGRRRDFRLYTGRAHTQQAQHWLQALP